MDPLTGFFLFGLYKATEKVWDKAFDAAWEPVDDSLKSTFRRWAGKGEERARMAAFARAAEIARRNTLAEADDPSQASAILDALDHERKKDVAETLVEIAGNMLYLSGKVNPRGLETVVGEELKWDFMADRTSQPTPAEVAKVVATFLPHLRDALLDQEPYESFRESEIIRILRRIERQGKTTTQYPTEADYRAQVIAVDGNLDFTGIAVAGRRDAVRVDELFAHLKFKAEEDKIVTERDLGESEITLEKVEQLEISFPKTFPMRSPVIFRGKRQPIQVDLPEAIRRELPLVILGDPGSGKTTLLKYLAAKAAFGEAAPEFGLDAPENSACLPIFASLRGFAAEASRPHDYSLLDYFHTQAYERYSLDLPPDFFKNALNEKRCLVLLDGLDEVWERGHRVEVRDAVHALASHYPGNRFVITSRIAGYEAVPLDRAIYPHYTVQPLGNEEIKTFITTWYKLCEPDAKQRDELAQGLIDALENLPNILDLARNPLLLTIIALVHRNEADLPQNRATLYEKCVQTLLEEWEVRKRLSTAEKSRPFYMYREDLLELLAYDMHTEAEQPRQLRVMHQEELISRIAGYISEELEPTRFPNKRSAIGEAKDFMRFVAARTGLLVERGQGEFVFPHLTFQEYLAAREIKRHAWSDVGAVWEEIKAHLHSAHWREVIILLLGMLGKESRGRVSTWLVRRILEQQDLYEDVLHRHLFLAAEVCADRVALAPDIVQAVVDELLTLAWEAHIGTLRYDSIRALGSLEGNQYAAKGLLTLARDRKVTSGVRHAAAEALGHMGQADRFLLESLLAIARDGNEDSGVRAAAAFAVGKLGRADEAVELLLALARDANRVADVRLAAKALGQLGRANEAGELMYTLACDTKVDAGVRRAAAEALGQLGQVNEAVVCLLALVCDVEVADRVRSDAAQALGHLGRADQVVLRGLLTLVNETTVAAWVRRHAALALGQLGQADEVVLQSLLTLIYDTKIHAEVRVAAALALGQLGQVDEAVGCLSAFARDPKEVAWVRHDAAEALGQLGRVDEAISQDLLALLRNANVAAEVRTAAAQALGQLGRADAGVLHGLLTLARDEKVAAWVRRIAAEILGQLGRTQEAIDLLLALAHDTKVDAGVRHAAAQALRQLGLTDKAGEGLLALARYDQVESWVRDAAYRSLKQLVESQ